MRSVHARAARDVAETHFRLSREVPQRFFQEEAGEISRAALAMARRFARGGRLLAFGDGPAAASDAAHISVEFVHPVLVGKRPLPALVLTPDAAAAPTGRFARQLAVLARPTDIAIGLVGSQESPAVPAALVAAGEAGLLTIALSGAGRAVPTERRLDFSFSVPSDDPYVVQETHETLYHIFWEIVHLFFEHGGLLDA